MNTRSIKFRLTFWYSLATLISIALIFSAFLLITKKILFDQTDNILYSHAESIINVVKDSSNEYEMIPQNVFINQFSEVPGMLVLILDRSHDKKDFTSIFSKAIAGEKYIIQNQKIGSSSMRAFAQKLKNSNKVILIAHPIDVIEKSLQSLSVVLTIAFILLMLPTILIGKLLAEKIIKPVDLLNEALKRERQFIGDTAHELKTPLATLRSNIEVSLSKKRSNEEYKKTLNETLQDSNKISQTLKNILDLAWSQADTVANQTENINLSTLTQDLLEIATKIGFQKQIIINAAIEPKVVIFGKAEKLSRAILNIIDNAIKYSPKKGKVNISLSKKRGKAILIISDRGVGIAQKDLPFIFERFYRGSKTKPAQGFGLGLAIAKNIVISHHGTIDVQSQVGKGTTVKLIFPLMKS